MKKEFVPYDIALALKELGFDESCIAYHEEGVNDAWIFYLAYNEFSPETIKRNSLMESFQCSAPLYQQAFRWFRQNKKINGWVYIKNGEIRYSIEEAFSGKLLYNYPPNEELDELGLDDFTLWKEAEVACLIKLVEIVKEK